MTLELVAYYYPEAIPKIEIELSDHDKMIEEKKKSKQLGSGAHH
jgi:hypothetical protein